MSLTAPFVPDVIPSMVGGIVQAQTAPVYKAANPTAKTPTKAFSVHYNGHTLSFQQAVPFVPDAGLLALLTALGSPVA